MVLLLFVLVKTCFSCERRPMRVPVFEGFAMRFLLVRRWAGDVCRGPEF